MHLNKLLGPGSELLHIRATARSGARMLEANLNGMYSWNMHVALWLLPLSLLIDCDPSQLLGAVMFWFFAVEVWAWRYRVRIAEWDSLFVDATYLSYAPFVGPPYEQPAERPAMPKALAGLMEANEFDKKAFYTTLDIVIDRFKEMEELHPQAVGVSVPVGHVADNWSVLEGAHLKTKLEKLTTL